MKRQEQIVYPKSVLEYRRKNPKPAPERVVLKSGKVRFFEVGKAADWLGCSAPALGMVLRGIPCRGNVIKSKAMAEFPELFKNGAKA